MSAVRVLLYTAAIDLVLNKACNIEYVNKACSRDDLHLLGFILDHMSSNTVYGMAARRLLKSTNSASAYVFAK